MTVPCERTRAVNQTREFLLELTSSAVTPRVPARIRERALSLLKHYPTQFDMQTISEREDNVEQPITYKVFGNNWL